MTGKLVFIASGLNIVTECSATHACVGLLSWLLTIYQTSILSTIRANWVELVVATLLAAVIDVDHFIEARSFSLKVVHLTNFAILFHVLVLGSCESSWQTFPPLHLHTCSCPHSSHTGCHLPEK